MDIPWSILAGAAFLVVALLFCAWQMHRESVTIAARTRQQQAVEAALAQHQAHGVACNCVACQAAEAALIAVMEDDPTWW